MAFILGRISLAATAAAGFAARSSFSRSMGLKRMLGSALILSRIGTKARLVRALAITGSFIASDKIRFISGRAADGAAFGDGFESPSSLPLSFSSSPFTIEITKSKLSVKASLKLSMLSGSKPFT